LSNNAPRRIQPDASSWLLRLRLSGGLAKPGCIGDSESDLERRHFFFESSTISRRSVWPMAFIWA
jgi:hypothetical protein